MVSNLNPFDPVSTHFTCPQRCVCVFAHVNVLPKHHSYSQALCPDKVASFFTSITVSVPVSHDRNMDAGPSSEAV